MSFGTYARRVRDESLPAGLRYRALRCSVARYHPLGFHATWAYVTAVARPSPDIHRDVSAWVRALDVLEESRAVWLAEVEAFAAARRAGKAAGRRMPTKADKAIFVRPRWPGAVSRLGLVAAVADRHRWFRRLPLPDRPSEGHLALRGLLDEAATSYLAELGSLEPDERESVVAAARQVEQAAHPRPAELELWRRFAALLRYAAEAV
ncbi:hypothetical protein Arub01_41360 [Actinomadura rubrobrunea]|uniref:Uncharacterized protein n=1 Tax=Actinomadura rubrobrunea TaxID=115335 RepID=A0A9W6Q059_9ACTN|nr:hypothetical protein [Actinomadura rubrobrunea]GLW65892.1 hypothetical protein Arub01_41360 [Actinomadura rubrobrunea]